MLFSSLYHNRDSPDEIREKLLKLVYLEIGTHDNPLVRDSPRLIETHSKIFCFAGHLVLKMIHFVNCIGIFRAQNSMNYWQSYFVLFFKQTKFPKCRPAFLTKGPIECSVSWKRPRQKMIFFKPMETLSKKISNVLRKNIDSFWYLKFWYSPHLRSNHQRVKQRLSYLCGLHDFKTSLFVHRTPVFFKTSGLVFLFNLSTDSNRNLEQQSNNEQCFFFSHRKHETPGY